MITVLFTGSDHVIGFDVIDSVVVRLKADVTLVSVISYVVVNGVVVDVDVIVVVDTVVRVEDEDWLSSS